MKNNIKIFRILYKLCPGYFILMILRSVFSSLSPLVNIYMAAKIINELSHSDLESLIRLAFVTVILNFIIATLSNFINKKYTDAEAYLSEKESNLYTEKAYQFDYDTIESPDTQKLRFDIIYAMMIDLHGTMGFRIKLEALCGQVIDLILSCVLFSGFISAVCTSSFGVYNIAVIILILLITAGYVLWSIKAETVEGKITERMVHSMENEQRVDRFVDSYQMGKDIRIYGLSRIVEGIRERSNTEKLNSTKEMEKARRIISLIDTAAMLCMRAGIYTSVILYVVKKVIGIGDFYKYVNYMERIANNITGIIRSLSALHANTPFLEQCLRFLEIESHMESGRLPAPDNENFCFEFENVSFRYPSCDEYALENISLRIDSKSKLAIVGKNGSGKTTFIKLLARLYDPTEGRILLNGKDIREYDYNQYMRIFSVVFQDFVIFPFTLGENISCFEEYDPSDVLGILSQLGITRLLADSYMYKTFEESGIEISGGEAQKIAIARAIYRNAPCIILDEPTAALDPISESEIYQNFADISHGKTSICISHRLSSCRFCDRIIVFDSGHIVQQGSHNDLVNEKDGEYFKLWDAQAQYYT